MAIGTLDQLIGATRQRVSWKKTGGRTTVANAWYSLFDVAGDPGAGTLAGTSTTTGVVPTDATAGCPTIDAFGGGATGYLAGVDFSSTVACRIRIYDLLWKAGAYAFNANTSGQTPTSFLSRIPGGAAANCAGCTEIWVETVTAATGNQTWNVTYTNEAGTTGRTTGAVGVAAAPAIGRMWQLPFAAGDKGVSGVTGVVGGTGSAGTANILVLRPLWTGRVIAANMGDLHDYLRTGMPQLFADSALFVAIAADSTAAGIPELDLTLANG